MSSKRTKRTPAEEPTTRLNKVDLDASGGVVGNSSTRKPTHANTPTQVKAELLLYVRNKVRLYHIRAAPVS